MNFRDLAIEIAEETDDFRGMLICALKYMSQDDVEDMLKMNEYTYPPEMEDWDNDQELEAYSLECAFGPEE
jgi:hypothetical protein